MSHAVTHQCRYCRRCQVAKAPETKPELTARHCQLPLGNGHSGHPLGPHILEEEPVHPSSPGLFSDQGSDFESRVVSDLCQAFGIKKSCTIPHHPNGDGLLEQMNRFHLNLLRCYVDREGDWEQQTLRIVPTPECCLTNPSVLS